MRRRRLLVLSLLPPLAGCAAPDPRPGPIRAMAPRPNPPVRAAAAPDPVPEVPRRLRRHPWLARFWEELAPDQRRRVAARLREADPGPRWDVMGLEDRARLVFGRGAPPAAAPSLAPPADPALARDTPPGPGPGG